MSRICVKNIPKHVREDGLRKEFSKKGEITDVKVIRTKNGKTRLFAFIGFRTAKVAQEAIRYFNKSFLDSHRITCEVAQKLGDANLPRPWSRHSRKKDNKAITPDVNNRARAKGHEDNSMDIDDPKLREFLQVMQPRATSKLWANDTSVASNDGSNQATLNRENDTSVASNDGSNQATLNRETKSTSVANHPILSDPQVDELPNNPKSNKKHELKRDGVIPDMDYFKSKVTTEWSDSESSDDDDNSDDNSDSASSDDDDKDKHSHATEHKENRGNNPFERTPRSGAQELDLEDQENTGNYQIQKIRKEFLSRVDCLSIICHIRPLRRNSKSISVSLAVSHRFI